MDARVREIRDTVREGEREKERVEARTDIKERTGR